MFKGGLEAGGAASAAFPLVRANTALDRLDSPLELCLDLFLFLPVQGPPGRLIKVTEVSKLCSISDMLRAANHAGVTVRNLFLTISISKV